MTGQGQVYEESDLVPIGKYPYNPKWPLYTGSDYGFSDNMAIVWFQTNLDRTKVYVIDSYQNSQKTIEFYVPFYTGELPPETGDGYTIKNYTKKEIEKIKEHGKWRRPRHFGDPAGKYKNIVSNKSAIRVLSKSGVFVFTNNQAIKFPPRREATKMLLRILYVNKGNEYFLECIRQAKYPESREGSQRTSTKNIKPVHDYTADYRAALEYFAVNIGIKRAKQRRINYLKNNTEDSEGNLKEAIREKESKRKVLRWSFRSYSQ